MESSAGTPSARRWQPLSAIDRRIVGVLAEKAKTTPDIYPMSLNAICTGCNQKSNRWPLMQLEPETVEESLDRLRELGAVGMVEGYGRVQKYRHYLYEWLGVDKVEIAVMTELLLRGDQTLGDLRVRASRMEPIADLPALRAVLDSLKAKGLVVALTPDGRGCVVTHALYKARELEALHAKYAGGVPPSSDEERPNQEELTSTTASPPTSAVTGVADAGPDSTGVLAAMHRELSELRSQLSQVRSDLDEVRGEQRLLSDEVRSLKEALGG